MEQRTRLKTLLGTLFLVAALLIYPKSYAGPCVPYFGVGVADHLVDGGGVVLGEPAQFPHLLPQVPGLPLQTAQLVIGLRREVQLCRQHSW